jgi:hypothetical protein
VGPGEAAALRATDRTAGDDPSEYLKSPTPSTSAKYAAWPAHIRAVSNPARTVKPGSRTIKLVRKEAA